MGRFLSGLSWSQPVASKAHALGMGLDDVQALVESRDAVVEHTRLHQYVFSLDGVRVIVDSRAWQILSVEAEHAPPRARMREPEVSSLDGWGFTDTARESIYRLGILVGRSWRLLTLGNGCQLSRCVRSAGTAGWMWWCLKLRMWLLLSSLLGRGEHYRGWIRCRVLSGLVPPWVPSLRMCMT